MVKRDHSSTGKNGPGRPAMDGRSGESAARASGSERESPPDTAGIRPTDSRLELGLWIGAGILFAVVAISVYLPVEPIFLVFPFWSMLTLAALLVSIIIAVAAGVGYGWPEGYR